MLEPLKELVVEIFKILRSIPRSIICEGDARCLWSKLIAYFSECVYININTRKRLLLNDKKRDDNEGGNFWRHMKKKKKYMKDALNDKL